MALINTIHGPVDESLLQAHWSKPTHGDGVKLTIVEYCLRECKGQAHRTHKPDAPEFFCAFNVHRSVDVVHPGLEIGTAIFGGLG